MKTVCIENEEFIVGRISENERELINQRGVVQKIYLDAISNVKDNGYLVNKLKEVEAIIAKKAEEIAEKYNVQEKQYVSRIDGKTGNIYCKLKE